MNKQLIRFASVVLTAVCMTLPCLVQEAGAIPVPKTTVPQGEFKIASSKVKDSVIIEANEAPIIPLLQAIAQQTNRKIIISDEAQEKGKELKLITYRPLEVTVDGAFALFSRNSLSWGKTGQDTYLVVFRQKSPDEDAAQKAEIDKIRKSLDQQRKEEPKQDPMQAPFNGRFWLLSPLQ